MNSFDECDVCGGWMIEENRNESDVSVCIKCGHEHLNGINEKPRFDELSELTFLDLIDAIFNYGRSVLHN